MAGVISVVELIVSPKELRRARSCGRQGEHQGKDQGDPAVPEEEELDEDEIHALCRPSSEEKAAAATDGSR